MLIIHRSMQNITVMMDTMVDRDMDTVMAMQHLTASYIRNIMDIKLNFFLLCIQYVISTLSNYLFIFLYTHFHIIVKSQIFKINLFLQSTLKVSSVGVNLETKNYLFPYHFMFSSNSWIFGLLLMVWSCKYQVVMVIMWIKCLPKASVKYRRKFIENDRQ